MPYRLNPSYNYEFYHLYNRGNNRERIFFENRNYDFFLNRLREYFADNIDIIAFCLMPNHYHILAQVLETGKLEKAMQRFSTSYTKAINKKIGRLGHLFQGRYKSKLIPNNDYLLHLSRYIHLNPVRAKLVSKPEEWLYSSYSHYAGLRITEFINSDIILDQVGGPEGYKKVTSEYDPDQYYYTKDLLF